MTEYSTDEMTLNEKGATQAVIDKYPEIKAWRMENVKWEPPILSFDVERHGGLALGSVYAEVYSYRYNAQTGGLDFDRPGRRLIGTKDKPWTKADAKALANELIARYERRERVKLSELAPFQTNKETRAGRVRRLRAALKELGKELRRGKLVPVEKRR